MKKKKSDKVALAKIAEPVESPTPRSKDQILRRFEELRRDVGRNFLELGLLIQEVNSGGIWKDSGYDSLGEFIEDVVGVSSRTGYDLMAISKKWTKILPPDRLEESAAMGWTKMRALCPIINDDNVDDWEARAEQMTYRQLKTEIERRRDGQDVPGDNEGEEIRKFSFSMVGGQIDVLERALEIAGRMTDNRKPNVLLEMVCAEFISTYQDGDDDVLEEPAI